MLASVNFGSRNTGKVVGYTLLDGDGTEHTARTTVGVDELGVSGVYTAEVTTTGVCIVWDCAGVANTPSEWLDDAPTEAGIRAGITTDHGVGLYGAAASGDTLLTQDSLDDSGAVIGHTTANAKVTAYLATATDRSTPERQTTAEVDGDWSLALSPDATYTLVFSKDGYLEQTATVTT
jgi:hypothetical protein